MKIKHIIKKWYTAIFRHLILVILLFAVLVGTGISVFVVISKSIPPDNFKKGTIVRITPGMSVSATAALLAEKNIIKSQFVYKAYVKILHDGKGVQAGGYLFDKPQSALRVAYRTAYGIDELQKVKIIIPEGSSTKEIAVIIKKSIPNFDAKLFSVYARTHEGYLFPETYFFEPFVTPEEVVTEMRAQFDIKIKELARDIATSTHSLSDIIIMASILEEEANNTIDRQMISGVLWNRIAIDMPLQVDAPFYYLFNKGSSQLTLADLATSSPYNTYKNKGLPAGPISNPGLDSIRATLYPASTKYLFYLADRKGVTHYAVTHDEHVQNKWKYLQ